MTLRSLADGALARPFQRGDRLVVQGESVLLVLITNGHAAVRRASPEGKQIILLVAGPDSLVGAFSVRNLDSPFDLVALSEGNALCWAGDFARHLAAANTGLVLDLLDWLVDIGQSVLGRVDGCMFYDTRRRLAHALVTYTDLAFADRQPVISRSDLAALVGASREMTGRALRQLEADQIVARVGRSGLRLLDPGRLEAIADHG